MKTEDKARMAQSLRDDEAFQLFTQEFREDCIAAFANSTASQTEKREEAHAHLRALQKLEGILDAAMTAQALDERKAERHGRETNRRAAD